MYCPNSLSTSSTSNLRHAIHPYILNNNSSMHNPYLISYIIIIININ